MFIVLAVVEKTFREFDDIYDYIASNINCWFVFCLETLTSVFRVFCGCKRSFCVPSAKLPNIGVPFDLSDLNCAFTPLLDQWRYNLDSLRQTWRTSRSRSSKCLQGSKRLMTQGTCRSARLRAFFTRFTLKLCPSRRPLYKTTTTNCRSVTWSRNWS